MKVPRNKFSQKEIEEIRYLYVSGWSSRKIAGHMDCSKKPILDIVNDIVRPRSCRKYIPNEDSFKNISSKDTWYWAGFIASDGNVSYKHRDKNATPVISIVSQYDDAKHLEMFSKWVGLNKEVTLNKDKNFTYIEFASKIIANDLYDIWNVPHCKSMTLRCPNMESKLMSHYIRGVFDGDGCISNNSKAKKNKVSNPSCEANITTASKEFLKDLQKICPDGYALYHDKRSNASKIRWQNFNSVFSFMEWIYKDSEESIRLSRKFDIWNSIKDKSSKC